MIVVLVNRSKMWGISLEGTERFPPMKMVVHEMCIMIEGIIQNNPRARACWITCFTISDVQGRERWYVQMVRNFCGPRPRGSNNMLWNLDFEDALVCGHLFPFLCFHNSEAL